MAEFHAAMDDDFNTPDAFAVMQGVARELNSAKANPQRDDVPRRAATLRAMGRILGILQQDAGVYLKRAVGTAALSDEAIEQLVEQRRVARAAKQFAESDRLREVLAEAGVLIEDKPGGSTGWRRA
jgi:cysteinyl-tRNA synthetase